MRVLVWIGHGEVSLYHVNDINFEEVLSSVDEITEWYDDDQCVKQFSKIKNWQGLVNWVNQYPRESDDENFEKFEIVELK